MRWSKRSHDDAVRSKPTGTKYNYVEATNEMKEVTWKKRSYLCSCMKLKRRAGLHFVPSEARWAVPQDASCWEKHFRACGSIGVRRRRKDGEAQWRGRAGQRHLQGITFGGGGAGIGACGGKVGHDAIMRRYEVRCLSVSTWWAEGTPNVHFRMVLWELINISTQEWLSTNKINMYSQNIYEL